MTRDRVLTALWAVWSALTVLWLLVAEAKGMAR